MLTVKMSFLRHCENSLEAIQERQLSKTELLRHKLPCNDAT